jgi:hypothetical protein
MVSQEGENVSEKHAASIFRAKVTKLGSEGLIQG